MKKLLAMLTTITSLSSISPIILANASAEIPENKIINKEINSLQTSNLPKLKRVKREQIKNQQKIVITAVGKVYSGTVLNNKLYFGSFDNNVYEYDPATNQQKIVIVTGGVVTSLGVVLNNKIYFGSSDHKVYEYEPNNLDINKILSIQPSFDTTDINGLRYTSENNIFDQTHPAATVIRISDSTYGYQLILNRAAAENLAQIARNNNLNQDQRRSRVLTIFGFRHVLPALIGSSTGGFGA
jgi:hypothetical protein